MPARTESPPKRVTRSRAKAVAENKIVNKPVKITIQSAKATATRTTKRKIRTEDEEDEPAEGEILKPKEDEPAEKPAPGRRPAATVARTAASVTKTRAAPRSAAAASTKVSRGRSKNGGEPEEEMATDEGLEPSANAPPTRSTRTRTTSVTEALSAAEPRAGRPTTKKKVTFRHDESDKENSTVNALSSRRAASKKVETTATEQIGTMVRPNRGSAARGGRSTRGGRAQSNLRASPRSTLEPLSPKKNAQVSVKVPEGREIKHATSTPAEALQKSPVKAIPGSIHKPRELPAYRSPTKAPQADDDATMDELQSSVAIFTSPAKRLPPALQKSPTRAPESAKIGAFEQSPRKFGISLLAAASTDSAREHKATLFMPAIKFPMSGPTKQPLFDASKQRPDLEKSMFKSPPKRPASPIKDLHFGSSVKPYTSTVMKAMTSSGVTGTPRKLFSPVKTVSSAFRAYAATPKVHKMTPEEQAQMFEDELNNAPSPFHSIRSSFQATPVPIKPGSKIPIRSPPRSPERTSPERSDESLASHLHITRYAPRDENPGQSTLRKEVFSTSFRTKENDFKDEDDSEDELFANESTIVRSPLASKSIMATPKGMSGASPSTEGPVTVLAKRLGHWTVGTSDLEVLQQPKTQRSAFSPLAPRDTDFSLASSPASSVAPSPLHDSHFEPPIAIHEDEDVDLRMVEEPQPEELVFRQSQMSDASQEYGDENALPIDPSLLDTSQDKYFCTPQRTYNDRPQTMSYTVSKVPLKPAADEDTPQPKLARRGHSLSGSLSPQADFDLGMFRQLNPAAPKSLDVYPHVVNGLKCDSKFIEQLDDISPSIRMPSTPGTNSNPTQVPATPARTPRPDLSSSLLAGTVVFVDVHTTEGADASGIFVELLAQMGAKCVKQWNWNSRSSAASSTSAIAPGESGNDNVGITHVVFKDGGRRTMEKVREAKGAVLCVGVGWVLDCEKRNEWCNEADYAIDTSTIPRGGHRRRKSMEPKLLSSMTFSPLKVTTAPKMSPTKEFLNLESPPPQRDIVPDLLEDRRVSFATVPPPPEYSPQATPSKAGGGGDPQYGFGTPSPSRGYDESNFGSPTTPYFLHPQQLVQQTCPPKQTQQLFFPISGKIEDQPDEHIRQRLLLARRKSLQWAPRVASPLSRTQSYQ